MTRWSRRLFDRRQADRELDAELRFHLEQQIADYVAGGMSPGEARRRAQIEFGGLQQVKEECREVRWETQIENFFRDFRFAIRGLAKDRRFALVAIFALTLGIGATTVVFSVFYNLLFNPFDAKDAKRLAVPSIEKSGVELFPLTRSLTNFEAMREQNNTFEDMVGYYHRFVLLSDGNHTRQVYVGYVTANALSFYGVPPLLGRGITAEDGEAGAAPVFVIGYKTWKGDFNGNPNVLGKSFTVDGERRTLVGIMPPRFQAYGATVSMWLPTNTYHTTSAGRGPDLFILGRLKPGISLETAAADLDLIFRRLAKIHPNDFPEHFTTRVQSATDYFLGP